MRKTKKAVSKRFIKRKSGKIKRSRAGKSHLMTGKSRKRKRALRQGAYVSSTDLKTIGRMLPHG